MFKPLSFHPLDTTIKFRENLQNNKVEVYYFSPPKEKEQGGRSINFVYKSLLTSFYSKI